MYNFDSTLPNGVFAASITPLKKDYRVDLEALVAHCNWLLKNGNDGICLLGTTGEANSFSVAERKEVIDYVVANGIPAQKLIVGTGCCAMTDTIELTKHAVSKKVGGVLMLPPFYYKGLSEDGLANYFGQVINGVDDKNLKIYLYHFPKMTSVPFTLSLVRRLAKEHNGIVVGMKDSSGDWEGMKAICEALPGFKIYAGTEKYLLDILKIGGAGCISATTNATGKLAAAVYQNKDKKEAVAMQDKLTAARLAFEGPSFISGVKYMFAKWMENDEWLNVRPPINRLTITEATELESKLEAIQFKL